MLRFYFSFDVLMLVCTIRIVPVDLIVHRHLLSIQKEVERLIVFIIVFVLPFFFFLFFFFFLSAQIMSKRFIFYQCMEISEILVYGRN